MSISRRTMLKGLTAAGVTAATACSNSRPNQQVKSMSTIAVPAEPTELLLNHAHAIEVMEKEKVDLILCGDPLNIYYVTNQYTVQAKIGMDGLAYASLSASALKKPKYIGGRLTYYFDAPPSTVTNQIDFRYYSTPAEAEAFEKLETAEEMVAAAATPGYMPRQHDEYPETLLESSRRKLVEADIAEMNANADAAVLAEILEADLPNKTIAVDDLRLRMLIEKSGVDVRIVDGERLLRRIRTVKTASEMELMRYAALANSEAGLLAAQSIRAGATFRDARLEFWKYAGERMCNAKYLMLDTHTPDLADGEFFEGRSFLIDCVSVFQGYHGDYGRTVCIGEPNRKMQSIIDTLSNVWDRVLEQLRPGYAFADIYALCTKLFDESKVDTKFAVNPHLIGLHHSDDPSAKDFSYYQKENIVLQENMVLSVDMPVLGTGMGGSAHLEDLVVITKDGAELLNDTNNRFIIV